jgi:hypothetical protein
MQATSKSPGLDATGPRRIISSLACTLISRSDTPYHDSVGGSVHVIIRAMQSETRLLDG